MGCNNDYCDIDMNDNATEAADRNVPKMAYWKYVLYRGIMMDGEEHIIWFCPACNKEATRIMGIYTNRNEMPPDGAAYCRHCGQRLEYPTKENFYNAWRGNHEVEVRWG